MGMTSIIAWYQKKIGNNDERKWEKTIEHRDYKFSPVDLKSAELKTGLIDLDLVRGSSFTKAKPKHGFFTVTRLATLRFFLFPFYLKWWLNQTSSNVCCILLILYLMQLFNIGLYFHKTSTLPKDSVENISTTEIIVPVVMMWILSMIHSQIVATNPISEKTKPKCKVRKTYRRRCSKWNSVKLHNIFSRRCEIPRSTIEYLDDGFESFNGNGTSTSDNEILSSPDGKFISKCVGTDEDLGRKCDSNQEGKGKNATYIRYRTHSTKRLMKRNDSRELAKSSESMEKAPAHASFVTRKDKPSSSEDIDSNSDTDSHETIKNKQSMFKKNIAQTNPLLLQNLLDSDEYDWATLSSNIEGIGATTNSEEECSYSSELDDVSQYENNRVDNTHEVPSCIYSSDKVNCTIWHVKEFKEASLSVLDISSIIVTKVENVPESMDYFYFGIFFSSLIAVVPALYRLCYPLGDAASSTSSSQTCTAETQSALDLSDLIKEKLSLPMLAIINSAFCEITWEHVMMIIGAVQRFTLAFLFCFLLTVAERTFKQRFLYAKFFSHLTSSRRARKSALPHFRLNKVCNIRTWLSVRSYLKKRGPQRSVDVIVSAAFIIQLLLLSFLSMELLKDSAAFHSQYNIEAFTWCIGLGVLLLRFMTLGTKINYKYVNRNLLILTTEQINLYLQIEQNPDKKEKLTVANNVLKLAADLLKDTESPFMILGLSANPYLYAITKLVILSALSGVLSEMLGFKLKLHKIKVK